MLIFANPLRADEGSAALEDGFVSLFDGETLAGWEGARDAYRVEDGILTSRPGESGNLETINEYEDFILRFEFRLTSGSNSGIGLRMPAGGHAAYDGLEIQILDDSHPRYAMIKPYQCHGSIYGIAPARRGFLKPVGEWNEQEIRCEGRQIAVVLNGEEIVNADLDEATASGPLDAREHPGLKRSRGHIGLLGHLSEVSFRNLRLRPLGE